MTRGAGRLRTAATTRLSRDARPRVAVDTILFAFRDHQLQCYLVELARGEAAGQWAFPGRLVRIGEKLDEAARADLAASTGLRDVYLEQLFTFGDPTRDPRTHVVSVAYMGLTAAPETVSACSAKYAQGRWCGVERLPRLAYDHPQMADYALNRLRAKLEYTNIALYLLPPAFTFAQLEELYATVLERELDRRNFRRRILASGLLRRLSQERRGAHRPAALYEFAPRSLRTIEML
ncbi:MAG TPA: NUDIX domain-containing protein [Candidatus Binataceae bacterium]|nr:NUDIX domain-containing protein [Candidatus Binataceae bacterium]